MHRVGVPQPVVKALAGAWEAQNRWVTYGGSVDPWVIRRSLSLLQGDCCWSPFALALLLTGPMRKANAIAGILQTLYMDDQTAAARDIPSLRSFLHEWQEFENMVRLKTHPGKTQFGARTPAALQEMQQAGFEAEETVQVLGMTIGMPGKGPSNNEMERLATAGRKADELSTLPIRADLKQRLAATVVAPTATWGFGIGGRWPNKSETKNFLTRFDLSTKCPQFPAGRSSKPLRQVFFLGHVSDLLFQAVARTARASFQWHLLRAKHGQAVEWTAPFAAELSARLEMWGWKATQQGLVDHRDRLCRLGSPMEQVDATLHLLRISWRKHMFDQWLSADRIDSKLARQLGCHLSAEQIDVLRKQFKNRHGHEVAVACGGMMAPSINFERLQAGRPVLQQCPYCQQQIVPSVSHIFWHCPHFDHARSLPAPVDELQQRLGWSVDGNLDLDRLVQMGVIRGLEAHVRLKPPPEPDLEPPADSEM